jgi:hypothetical protein
MVVVALGEPRVPVTSTLPAEEAEMEGPSEVLQPTLAHEIVAITIQPIAAHDFFIAENSRDRRLDTSRGL